MGRRQGHWLVPERRNPGERSVAKEFPGNKGGERHKGSRECGETSGREVGGRGKDCLRGRTKQRIRSSIWSAERDLGEKRGSNLAEHLAEEQKIGQRYTLRDALHTVRRGVSPARLLSHGNSRGKFV